MAIITKQYSISCCRYIGEGNVNKVGAVASSEIWTSSGSTEAVPNGRITVDG